LFVVEPDFTSVSLDLESAKELPDFLPSSLAASLDDDTLETSDRALHTLLEAHNEPFDAGGDSRAGVLELQLGEVFFRLVQPPGETGRGAESAGGDGLSEIGNFAFRSGQLSLCGFRFDRRAS